MIETTEFKFEDKLYSVDIRPHDWYVNDGIVVCLPNGKGVQPQYWSLSSPPKPTGFKEIDNKGIFKLNDVFSAREITE